MVGMIGHKVPFVVERDIVNPEKTCVFQARPPVCFPKICSVEAELHIDR